MSGHLGDMADPAVFGALAYLGVHDDFPVYWDDVLDFPVVLGEKRVRLGDLRFVDVLELLNACHVAGLSEQAAGVRVLVEMMCKESILVVREIESGFVRGPVGVVAS